MDPVQEKISLHLRQWLSGFGLHGVAGEHFCWDVEQGLQGNKMGKEEADQGPSCCQDVQISSNTLSLLFQCLSNVSVTWILNTMEKSLMLFCCCYHYYKKAGELYNVFKFKEKYKPVDFSIYTVEFILEANTFYAMHDAEKSRRGKS